MPITINLGSAGQDYTENQGDLTLFDSATLISDGDSMVDTIKISLNNAFPTELLSVDILPAGYTSSFDPNTSILTIGNGTGDISDSNWESILRSVQYNDSSDNPPETREITVFASDTIGPETSDSLIAGYVVVMEAINDTPVIAGDLAATIIEESNYLLTVDDLGEADPDDDIELTYTVTSQTNGAIKLNGFAAISFTVQDVADGIVSFSHDGSETVSAGFDFSLADNGEDGVSPATSTFNFTVAPANDIPSGVVTMDGIAQENSILTANTDTISDDDGLGTFSYQWLRNNIPILNATGSTYQLESTDVGNQISVTVNYNDSMGTAESLTSEPTEIVSSSNNHPPVLIAPLVNQAILCDRVDWIYDTSASFEDEDLSDSLSYSATLANDNSLPDWIQIDATTGLMTGAPALGDRGTYALNVVATDSQGSSVSAALIVAVTVFDAGQLLVSTAGNDSLTGTSSNDTATYAYATAPIGVSLSITTEQNTGAAGSDILANIDNLIGSDYNDSLTGNLQNNVLDGGVGVDTLAGKMGDDTYIVDIASDIIIEKFNEGIDKVNSSVTYALPGNIENLTLIGASNVNGTGNGLANLIVGNAVNNTLNGSAGADTLIGKLGDDNYVVDHVNEVVTENFGEGTDTISSKITYTLSANVENLTLTGTSIINGTGNELSNILMGNSAANQLDGGGNADTLKGGTGDDTYIVDHVGDIVTESFNAGIDAVNSSITYRLLNNIENMNLTGTLEIDGTGNGLVNLITGNAAINKINGGAGADIMIGGLGGDIYFVDNENDTITEYLNEGIDKVNSSKTYTLPDHVENLSLTGTLAINATGNEAANTIIGNTASNQLIGGAGNDILNGAEGANIMTGGAGKDYFQFKTADHIIAGRMDTITDFNVVDDTIKLENNIFTAFATAVTPDRIAADQFVIGTQALDANDYIIYNRGTGALLYDDDGSGMNVAVQFASVSAGLAMTNWDVHVI